MSQLISIIMPAYNAADCIKRGIESCLLQTFSDWELLIVDDGSTDSTAELVHSYCGEDSRIRYLHQDNAGVSKARNYGLDEARGDYVVFLDADDWLRRDALEILLRLQEANPDCLIACNRSLVKEEDAEQEWRKSISMQGVSEGKDQTLITKLTRVAALQNTGTQRYNNSSVNKIFNRKVIEACGIRFDPCLFYGEDGLFVFDYLLAVRGMLHYNACLWNLLERNGSATRGRVTLRNLTAIQAVEAMRNQLRTREKSVDSGAMTLTEIEEIDHALQVYGGSTAYNLVRRYIECGTRTPEAEKVLKNALRRYCRDYCLESGIMSGIKYLVMVCCPFGWYRIIYHLTHRK